MMLWKRMLLCFCVSFEVSVFLAGFAVEPFIVILEGDDGQ